MTSIFLHDGLNTSLMTTPRTGTIFIADDDPEDLVLLEEAILNHKPSVVIKTFRNSDALLNALVQESSDKYPSLIILDYNMPPATGVEVLLIMKNFPHLFNVPKLVWSSSSNADHIRACFANGAAGYFAKPCSVKEYEELAAKVCSHLKIATH
ncbi:response regulator [Pinibacter soli]|uniref:Response regulator n=1 Tax=Pinibacter soli TaxID=3044211 RepID=A0ABT6RDP1_9BACT|nr:response regulator [Pinibacter soli]MDI3320693.1 response regulator [Pinibacter soli]